MAVNFDEDALICDMAETYKIYDYKALPITLTATLFCGLPPESRIKMKMSGQKTPLKTIMLGSVLDKLNILIWMQTEDGYKGMNRPDSIVDFLLGTEKQSDGETMIFDTADQFKNKWERLTKGGD